MDKIAKKTILIDIDGTICKQCSGNYEGLEPNKKAIKTINRLYGEGYKIVFYTSRFMGRSKENIPKTYELGYKFTINQLNSWGVKFNELVMGKPRGDLIIDDRSLFFLSDWDKIYNECKK